MPEGGTGYAIGQRPRAEDPPQPESRELTATVMKPDMRVLQALPVTEGVVIS